jgi:hypothetical protein
MEPPYQLRKVSDEGSTSPFVARIFMASFEYRDLLADSRFTEQERTRAREVFDRKFTPLLDAAQSTRDAARDVISLVTIHRINIASKRIVKIHYNQYDILETIDIPLGQAVDKVIIQGTIAIKTGLQSLLANFFDLKIGFVFQRTKQFESGISNLRKAGEDDFAEYLVKVRETWIADLMNLRNQREHEGQRLESVHYGLIDSTSVGVIFPSVLNIPVDQFARYTANRVLLFIENTLAYGFQRMVGRIHPIGLAEIPPEQRDPSDPQRFRLFPIGLEPSLPWRISYREDVDFV